MYSYVAKSVFNDHLGSSNDPYANQCYIEVCYKEVEVYFVPYSLGIYSPPRRGGYNNQSRTNGPINAHLTFPQV